MRLGTGSVTTSTVEIATVTAERPDKHDPRILRLLERGQRQKYLSQAEILGAFPDAGTNVDLREHLYALFEEEPVEPAIGQSEKDEQLARICELARRLGFNDAKTKMLIGQSAGDLAGLEGKLLNELDDQPRKMSAGNGDKGQRWKQSKEAGQTSEITAAKPPTRVPAEEGGFPF